MPDLAPWRLSTAAGASGVGRAEPGGLWEHQRRVRGGFLFVRAGLGGCGQKERGAAWDVGSTGPFYHKVTEEWGYNWG